MPTEDLRNVSLVSTVTSLGRVELSLVENPAESPGDGEILIAVDATPVNPSDFLYLVGPADLSTLVVEGEGSGRVLAARADPVRAEAVAARFDRPVTVGNEGTGIVVRAGRGAEHLQGKRVSAFGSGMFCRYRKVPAQGCIVLPDDAAPAEAAGLFVNPLTALTMVELMRREGHRAIVHTAAASNLGQMLVKICRADGIELVNIVRSPLQVELLRELGARHVIDSTAPDFEYALAGALAETGATLTFDAVGGGRLAHRILRGMELVGRRGAKGISHGTATRKQVLLYGRLDRAPLELDWDYGVNWSVGLFVMTDVLADIGEQRAAELRDRISRERATTFVSGYAGVVGLADMLEPRTLQAIARKGTGGKLLLDPTIAI